MAQLSRPYQLALAAIALLGLVWVVALRGHATSSGGSTGSTPSAPAPATNAKAEEKAAAAPTPIYHGAAPGVEGLTRAIAKAHGAVATSQRNAQQLQQHSREASREGFGGSTGSAQSTGSGAAHRSTVHRGARGGSAQSPAAHPHAPSAQADANSGRSGAAKQASDQRPAGQIAVEREVARGKTVLLLFWSSKSSVDREVRSQVQALVSGSKGRLALHAAAPNRVGEFGSATEVVHVYQTPTILIVNRHGVVSTLTGLTDAFALQQVVREAESASH